METREAKIIINGILLNYAQASTLRVAISSFIHELKDPDHLGEDEIGRSITKNYKNAATEIQDLIFGKELL